MVVVFKCVRCRVTNLLLDFMGISCCKICKTALVEMLNDEQILKERLFEI